MSAAVYYNVIEDIPKHTLPSLAQIMPMAHEASPSNTPSMLEKYPHQSPDVFSQSLQASTANTTPVSSFSTQNYHGNSYTTTNMVQHSSISGPSTGAAITEKCICKSNANRIPRPRNAFILFRQKYHQSVLDEGNVIRTNPEVSRELGRRWRGLSPDEKDHWNNLAEDEKKNHAKKYPGYRYTPRRNGKLKNCIACRQKALRQQQVQLHNQQMIQMQQEQYQQYLQLQQKKQQQLQMVPVNSSFHQQFLNPYQGQAQQFGQQSLQQIQQSLQQPQQSLQQPQQSLQLLLQPQQQQQQQQQLQQQQQQQLQQQQQQQQPQQQQQQQLQQSLQQTLQQPQQQTQLQHQQQPQQQLQQPQQSQPFQFTFNNDISNTLSNSLQNNIHDKLSPLSHPTYGQPAGSDFSAGTGTNQFVVYENMEQHQRFNSLPNPSGYGFDGFQQ